MQQLGEAVNNSCGGSSPTEQQLLNLHLDTQQAGALRIWRKMLEWSKDANKVLPTKFT